MTSIVNLMEFGCNVKLLFPNATVMEVFRVCIKLNTKTKKINKLEQIKNIFKKTY
jgi:hypothetical protein